MHILGWKCLTLGLLQDHRVQCTVWVPSNIFSRDPAIARIWPCIFSNQSPAPFLSYSSVWILSSDHPGNKNPLTGFYLFIINWLGPIRYLVLITSITYSIPSWLLMKYPELRVGIEPCFCKWSLDSLFLLSWRWINKLILQKLTDKQLHYGDSPQFG